MNSKITFFIALLTLSIVCNAQDSTNQIILVRSQFYDINMHRLSENQVLGLMKDHPDALSFMKKANSSYNTGIFLYILGCGSAIAGAAYFKFTPEPNYNLALGLVGGGLALGILAIPISYGYRRNVKKAINLYNADINKNKSSTGCYIKFGQMKNGIGIALQF